MLFLQTLNVDQGLDHRGEKTDNEEAAAAHLFRMLIGKIISGISAHMNNVSRQTDLMWPNTSKEGTSKCVMRR